MLRAFWGAAPRTDCWAGMRARDLLASIIEGRIEKRESVVSLCREFSRVGGGWEFGRRVGVSELSGTLDRD